MQPMSAHAHPMCRVAMNFLLCTSHLIYWKWTRTRESRRAKANVCIWFVFPFSFFSSVLAFPYLSIASAEHLSLIQYFQRHFSAQAAVTHQSRSNQHVHTQYWRSLYFIDCWMIVSSSSRGVETCTMKMTSRRRRRTKRKEKRKKKIRKLSARSYYNIFSLQSLHTQSLLCHIFTQSDDDRRTPQCVIVLKCIYSVAEWL